jgi:hypothetical protein
MARRPQRYSDWVAAYVQRNGKEKPVRKPTGNILAENYDGQLLDIIAPAVVHLQLEEDRLWVNVNGVCRFRVCQIGKLVVDVNKPKEKDDEES